MKSYILICYSGYHKYFEIFTSKTTANKRHQYLKKNINFFGIYHKKYRDELIINTAGDFESKRTEFQDFYKFEIIELNLKNKDEIISVIDNLSVSWDHFLEDSSEC